MPAKIYGVICTKGGVGKTTTGANTAAILADMGQRVLLIDTDPVQAISLLFPLSHKADYALTQLYRTANPDGCISKTIYPNLDIVINDDPGGDNGVIVNFLRESVTHFQHLYIAVQTLKDAYDYIFIDTQGARGLIQESVVFASDVLFSPITPNVLDAREFLNGTVALFKKFQPKPGFPSITGRPLPPVKVLINFWDTTNIAKQVSRYLRSEFDKLLDGQVTVLTSIIPRLTVYREAVAMGLPVHRLEQSRPGSSLPALQQMLELIYELEPKLIGIEPKWEGMATKKPEGASNE